MNIVLSINFNMCFECSKEPSHGDDSFEYLQNMFCIRNDYALLSRGLVKINILPTSVISADNLCKHVR